MIDQGLLLESLGVHVLGRGRHPILRLQDRNLKEENCFESTDIG